MSELHDHTALELLALLRAGQLRPVELTEHYLARIERLNPAVGAFETVTADAALTRARAVETDVPKAAPLWGMPIGDKDLAMRAGVPTRYGSRLMRDFVPESSDDVVIAAEQAGAVSLGKTATPEFGLPSYTEGLAFAPARTPWDLDRGAGGSSGGAAAAVAAGMLPFAPGSDGGGSVRIPAAACGLVGLKASRGRVPAGSGLDRLAGLGVAGPLARTVADAALLLDGLVGPGGLPARHRFATRAPGGDGPFLTAAMRGEGRFQLGVTTTTPWDGEYDLEIDPAAIRALESATTELSNMGHGLEEFRLEPEPDYAAAFRTIWQVGASSIPAETEEQLALLEPLTRWLVLQGRSISARTLAEALGWLAEYEARLIRQLASYDAVLTPALAMTPRPIGWYDDGDGERNFEQQVRYTPFTSWLNVAGLPAIVLPVGQAGEGLPMGVQLIGRPGGEATLLAIGTQLERRFRWQERRPPIW
jgi:amidase